MDVSSIRIEDGPAIFQRILSNIIRKHKLPDFTVNYIDDILIFSKSFEEHVDHLSQLLEAIMKEGFRLKLSKCTFALDSIQYLGHIINHNSISPIKYNLNRSISRHKLKRFQKLPKKKKKITMIFTAVNAPFSNGLNERLNQTLINKIRCAINEERKRYAWTTIAHNCVEKYNETEHTVTKFSPKYLLQGEDTSTLPNELKTRNIIIF